ncbi:MAG: DUF2520 domain-containing protein [Clostridiales Family XIII bacterium]|jgi:predicted short-subunit dehydrogenase-like oxidoreductase (DUF2520 family)|nr:DUF2520 domain-containing protein [Clostridiales Family XIII bacterium]
MRIGFVGAGKAGTSFGKYIAERQPEGVSLSGYFSKSKGSAESAAQLTGSATFSSAARLAGASDLIVFSVPDGVIGAAWETLRPHLKGRIACHMSGSLGSDVFEGAAAAEVTVGSVHPLAALFNRETAWQKLGSTWFSIEGDAAFLEAARRLLDALGNPYCEIAVGKKVLYHTASAVCSNLVCAVAYTAAELYRSCGLPQDFAEKAWRPLFLENAKNVAALGASAALTGPLERGDADTIANHLEALKEAPKAYRDAYIALSKILIDTAKEKHPDRDYGAISAILDADD